MGEVNKAIVNYISKNILKTKKKSEEEEEKAAFSFFDYDHLEDSSIWYLSDIERKDFLIENMKPEFLENTIFAIVLDFTKPWEFLDQLAQWADVIFEINKKLFLQLPVAKQNKMRKDIENHFKFYKNPDKKKEEEFPQTQDSEAKDGEEAGAEEEMREAIDEMELEDGVLNVNLGVRVMIIWAKSEVISTGETKKYFDHRFEFIFKHLREFALRYGASLVFTSARKGTNLELLYSYLKHLFFDADFEIGPEVNNKESIFIPSGYDSPKFIQQLAPSIDDPYNKIVSNIGGGEEVEEKEIKWESWELLLDKLKDKLFEESEDSKEDTQAARKEEAVKKVQEKKIDPQTYFKSMIGKNNPRASTKKPNDGDKTESFKKKLRLDYIE
jgi:dynein light intermediate chain 1, cytosolic